MKKLKRGIAIFLMMFAVCTVVFADLEGTLETVSESDLRSKVDEYKNDGDWARAAALESFLDQYGGGGLGSYSWSSVSSYVESFVTENSEKLSEIKSSYEAAAAKANANYNVAMNSAHYVSPSAAKSLENAKDVAVQTAFEQMYSSMREVANAYAVEYGTRAGNENNSVAQAIRDKLDAAGDPVKLATGEYVQQETDLNSGGGFPFSVERFYGTENVMKGSIGNAWVTSLDERLLFGVDADPWKLVEVAKESAEKIHEQYENYIKFMLIAYDISSVDPDIAEAELNENIEIWKPVYDKIQLLYNKTRDLRNILPEFRKLQDLYSKVNETYEKTKDQYDSFTFALENLPNDYALLDELLAQYEKVMADYEYYKMRAERCDFLSALNKAAMQEDTPDSYYKTGLETITFIDESGYPHLFVADEIDAVFWIPKSEREKEYLSVSKMTDGIFVLSKKDDEKKYFNENGLIVKQTDRNNNETIFIRADDDDKKIVSIKTAGEVVFNVTWKDGLIFRIENAHDKTHRVEYSYKNDKLFSVTDEDGDVISFSYDDNGFLCRLNKSDSYVEFNYGLQDADGKIRATSTVNEMGFDEQFYYFIDEKKTVYKDHAGVESVTFYDEHLQTVAEILADGAKKEFEYDEKGNCIFESVNGRNTVFYYDEDGNKIGAYHSDGSEESWSYDEFGLVTSYRDRDGVIENWVRDENGNIISYAKGGRVVAEYVYDKRGLITEVIKHGSKISRLRYVYDAAGNVIRVQKENSFAEFTYDAQNRLASYSVDGKKINGYSYTNKTVTVKSYTGLEQIYTYNDRKDLISVLEKDNVTEQVRFLKYDYDKRHLPVAVYFIDGEKFSDDVLPAIEYQYDKAGKLTAELYRGDETNNDCWIKYYSYRDKNGTMQNEVQRIEQFKISKLDKISFSEINVELLKSKAGKIYSISYEKNITDTGTNVLFVDVLGRKVTQEYDEWMRPLLETNAIGEKNTFSVSKAGRLKKSQSAYGGFYNFSYDVAGNLINSGEENSVAIKMTHNADGSVETVTDRRGDVTVYTYDEDGRVATVQKAGAIASYDYDAFGRIAKISVQSSPLSQVAGGFSYNSRLLVEYSYSDDGRSFTKCEGGKYFTTYLLDAWGDVIKIMDGEGGTETYLYDEQRRISEKKDGYGNSAYYNYNAIRKICEARFPDGSFKKYEYDHLGNVTKISDKIGVYWRGDYDDAGRLIYEWKRGDVYKEYVYDALDRIVEFKIAGKTEEKYSYDARGKTVLVTDASGKNYVYTKDNFGRMISERNRTDDTKSFKYDAEGSLVFKSDFNKNEMSVSYLNGGMKKNISYLQKNSETASENNFSKAEKISFTNLLTGDIISAINESSDIAYEYDAGGKLARQKDNISGEDTLYIYDNAGRLSIVQSGNREIVYKYGKNGELLSVRDNKQRLSVDFEYDKMMRETKRTFSNGVSQHTVYDSAGRQIIISEYSPTGTLTRGEAYLYGADGKRNATVTHTGAVTKYEYNNRGQLVAIYYPDSEVIRSAQQKEAEVNGMYYQENATSPMNMFLSAGEHNELQSLLNKMQQSLGARLSTVQIFRSEIYSYDVNGNRISKTTPFGKIDYKYDAENRLLLSSSNGRVAVTYSYDANGNLLAKENVYKKSQYEYDARNRMIYSYELDKVNGVDIETIYEYDAYGRRVVVRDKGASPMRTVYDGFGFDVIRETASYASGEISDLYDTSIKYNGDSGTEKFGEARKERYHYAGKIYAESNLLAGDDVAAGGNQSAGGGQSAGESQSASGGSSANGGQFASESESASGNFSARSGVVSANVQTRYVGEKLPLYAKGNVVGVQLGNDTSYFGTDIIGSVRSVTDGYGSVKNLRDYDVFGNPLETDGYNSGLEYGYAGKPYDAVTEMYNYGFRDYSPATARFTTLDPIRDGTNWFSYVANDPVNFVDLWGLEMVVTVDKVSQSMTIAYYENSKLVEHYVYGGDSKKGWNGHANINSQITTAVQPGDPTKTSRTDGKLQSNGTTPTQFPDGLWQITGTKANPTSHEGYGKTWLTTNATQNLVDKDGKIVKDTGYQIHLTDFSNTYGCIGIHEKEIMDKMIEVYEKNERISPGTASIIVTGGDILGQTKTKDTAKIETPNVNLTGNKNCTK